MFNLKFRTPFPAVSLSSVAPPSLEEHENTFHIPVESYHRHDRYYLEDGVIFRVEHLHQIVTLSSIKQLTTISSTRVQVQNTLFKVPRYLLVNESSIFDAMFYMPNDVVPEGIVDTAPIWLPQVEVADFERLLELLYPLFVDLELHKEVALTANYPGKSTSLQQGQTVRAKQNGSPFYTSHPCGKWITYALKLLKSWARALVLPPKFVLVEYLMISLNGYSVVIFVCVCKRSP